VTEPRSTSVVLAGTAEAEARSSVVFAGVAEAEAEAGAEARARADGDAEIGGDAFAEGAEGKSDAEGEGETSTLASHGLHWAGSKTITTKPGPPVHWVHL
jgi:hypothetical protein